MQIYKDGVYKSCTPALYKSKFESLGYGVVTPLPVEVLTEKVEAETEAIPSIAEERRSVPRPKPRPRKGR